MKIDFTSVMTELDGEPIEASEPQISCDFERTLAVKLARALSLPSNAASNHWLALLAYEKLRESLGDNQSLLPKDMIAPTGENVTLRIVCRNALMVPAKDELAPEQMGQRFELLLRIMQATQPIEVSDTERTMLKATIHYAYQRQERGIVLIGRAMQLLDTPAEAVEQPSENGEPKARKKAAARA